MNKNSFILKLKKEKPTPRWLFILKSFIFWFLFLLFIIIGILSTSLIIYFIFNIGFDINEINLNEKIKFIFKSLPYLWIFITICFFIISYFNFKNTDNGYKYINVKNIALSLFTSIVIGILFYNIGFANFLDSKLGESIPAYKTYMTEHMNSVWNNPNNGLLIGNIKKINSNYEIEIVDTNNITWTILINNKTIIKNRVNIIVGNTIKIIGNKLNKDIFEATEIRPQFGMMMQNN